MLEVERTYPMGKLRVTDCPRCGSPAPSLQILGYLFRCTSCGLSGGTVQYLIARGRSCIEAAETLNIRLVPPGRVVRALRRAQVLFERELRRGRDGRAMELLRSRGIGPATASAFHLGATPPRGYITRRMLREGFSLQELCEAGLVCERSGEYTDWLFDRLIFPLVDGAGRTVGFSGRALSDREPKYLNTRSGPLGGRNAVLFGLHQAARAIREHGEAWVVEGYFDVMACWQAGLRWVVAPCGTTLSTHQALLLRRHTDRAVLLYDGDASADALDRAVRSLQGVGMSVRVRRLPPGLDPDQIVLGEGPQRLAEIAGGKP